LIDGGRGCVGRQREMREVVFDGSCEAVEVARCDLDQMALALVELAVGDEALEGHLDRGQRCAQRVRGECQVPVGSRDRFRDRVFHRRPQLRQVTEGFAKESSHADLERVHSQRLGSVGGHEHHGDVDAARAQRAAELDPRHPGHANVGDHRVGYLRAQRLEGLFGAAVAIDLVAARCERPAQPLAHEIVVFDENDANQCCPPATQCSAADWQSMCHEKD